MKAIYNFIFKKPKLNKGDSIKECYGVVVKNVSFDWVIGDWMILVQDIYGYDFPYYISRSLYNFYKRK